MPKKTFKKELHQPHNMFSTVVMEVVTCARNRDMKKTENRLKLYINMFSNRRQYKKWRLPPYRKNEVGA